MTRKLVGITALLLGCAHSGADGAADPGDPKTVAQVDLERYLGRWYEIARIPNSFQKSCAGNVTATYSRAEDHLLDVVNRCRTAEGEQKEASGKARVVPGSHNAKLEVSFFSIFGWRPIWGGYWVIGLDDDYQWAVVGTPDRDNGWILARAANLPQGQRERIDQILRDNGYDPARFRNTPQ